MTVTRTARSDFVAAALAMLDTPFHHQGRAPGVGLDCAGVVICALKQCGIAAIDAAGYGRIPAPALFAETIAAQFDPIDQADLQPGDLMTFAFRRAPQHIAVVSAVAPVMLVHAIQAAGRVVANSLDATWQQRLRGCYRVRGLI